MDASLTRFLLLLLLIPTAPFLTYPAAVHVDRVAHTVIILGDDEASAGSSRPGPAYPGAIPSPVSGLQTVLVILVDFPDKPHTKTRDEINRIFSVDLNRYYQEVSYGKISIRANATDWIRLTNSLSFYGQDIGDDIDHNRDNLIWDAIRAAQARVNFAQYRHAMILHSGYGQESSGVSSDLWSSHRFGLGMNVGATIINDVSVVPEMEANGFDPFGVYAHEFGHGLGLPDLYDASYKEDFLGKWDLMAKGNVNGRPGGSSPAHPSAWSKIKLGWLTQIDRVQDGVHDNLILAPQEAVTTRFQALMLPVGSDRYYLVEARDYIGYDRALPSNGVLVTYVDDQLTNGVVKVVNSKSLLRGLNDAPFDVGQTFNDTKSHIYLKVYAHNATGYGILVDRRGQLPDLAVMGVKLTPPAPKPKQQVTIAVTVRNQGTATSPDTVLDIYLDGKSPTRLPVPTLKPSQSTTITTAWNATGGTHKLRLVVDPIGKIDELDRTNNELNIKFGVGYTVTVNLDTLTVEIPANATIKVDGSAVNVDPSGSVQLAIPEGVHEVEAPRQILLGNQSRLIFDSWSDGERSNIKKLSLSDDLAISVKYRLQNSLTVLDGQGCVKGDGWYDATDTANITVLSPCRVQERSSRLVFAGWGGDVSMPANNASIPMDSPHELRASWKVQYYVEVLSPSSSGGGWYEKGSRATVTVNSPVYVSDDTRQVFVEWKGYSNSSSSMTVSVDGPKRLEATWKTQNKVNFKVAGLPPDKSVTFTVNGNQYSVSTPQPRSDWFDSGQRISFSVAPTEMKELWSMFQLKEFQDSSGKKLTPDLTVAGPTTVTAVYIKRLCILGLCFHSGWSSESLWNEIIPAYTSKIESP